MPKKKKEMMKNVKKKDMPMMKKSGDHYKMGLNPKC